MVLHDSNAANTRETLIAEMILLDDEADIETTLIILPDRFSDFHQYLDLVRSAESTVTRAGNDGIYQIASFHPDYLFAGSDPDDPANYTNRSLYPMLHLLRESSITKAIANYPDTAEIPNQNIAFAREKGLVYMQLLRAACIGE